VIYDELDLTLGTFKIRERGSPAGHNGARSVTGALGSQEWLRLRIGVGLDLPPKRLRPVAEAAGQGLSALADAQGGFDGSGRGAGPGGNGHAAHHRRRAGSRDERVQPERQGQGTGNRE
jgi:hypothetical protein